MQPVQIKLSSIQDVRNFVDIVCKFDMEIDLVSGRYVVDAKSILGIFSIDLSRPIRMDIYSDDCGDLLEALKDYIVKDNGEKA